MTNKTEETSDNRTPHEQANDDAVAVKAGPYALEDASQRNLGRCYLEAHGENERLGRENTALRQNVELWQRDAASAYAREDELREMYDQLLDAHTKPISRWEAFKRGLASIGAGFLSWFPKDPPK